MSGETEGIASSVSAALSDRPEVLEAYLFGSLSRGDHQPHSDVDLAVFVRPEALAARADYADELAGRIQAALRRSNVDLLILNAAGPLLYHRVLRDGIRIFSRDLRATTVREGRALSRYCDYLPQLEIIEAAHRRRIAAGQFGR